MTKRGWCVHPSTPPLPQTTVGKSHCNHQPGVGRRTNLPIVSLRVANHQLAKPLTSRQLVPRFPAWSGTRLMWLALNFSRSLSPWLQIILSVLELPPGVARGCVWMGWLEVRVHHRWGRTIWCGCCDRRDPASCGVCGGVVCRWRTLPVVATRT